MTFKAQIDSNGQIMRPALKAPDTESHKYMRGHALVFSGPPLRTGASRLTAQAALAVGAGLVTIVGKEAALKEHAAHVTAIMLRKRDTEFQDFDSRINAFAIGPGYGRGPACRRDVTAVANQGRATVMDADALTSFEDKPEQLFGCLHTQCVLTPHEGEFARLFPDIDLADRRAAVKSAAERAGAVIVLKGAETVLAHPDGNYAFNRHANSGLATAGSGDVLTGLICGIMAQGIPAFEAACVACWIHGDIAIQHGPGLTADRMIGCIPETLRNCLKA